MLATERRCAARTQLGMPAFAPPTGEPPSSAGERRAPAAGAGLVRAPARRGPPPLPARFAVPKVVIRSAPVPPGTIPARRLQLQDVTSELDGADLPPVTPRSLATQAPGGSAGASSRSAATNGGRQGMLTALLVRLLSLLAPSLQLQRAPREDRSTASRRRR